MESYNAIIYLIGLVGCAAFSLIPIRSVKMILMVVNQGVKKSSKKIMLIFAILTSVAAMLYEARVVWRIFNCATDAHCTYPGIKMWMYLTMFGIVYFAFEAIFFVIRKINIAIIK